MSEKIIRKNGETVYRARIRRKGYPPISEIFATEEEADKFERDVKKEIDEGKNILNIKQRKTTVHEFLVDYKEILNMKSIAETTKRDYINALDFIDKEIGYLYIRNLTVQDILPAIKKLKELRKIIKGSKTCKPKQSDKKISNNTFNKKLQYISAAFDFAVDKMDLLNKNPFKAIDRLPVEQKEPYIPEPDEINRLLHTCRETEYKLYMIALLALVTTSRKGEIIENLTIGSFDFENKFITIRKNKLPKGKIRHKIVPLTDFVIDEVKKYMKSWKTIPINKSAQFFDDLGNSKYLVEKIYPKVCRKVGLKTDELNFVFHDLRYSSVSYLGKFSPNTQATKSITGHLTDAMVDYYSRIKPDWLTPIVNASVNCMLSDFMKDNSNNI